MHASRYKCKTSYKHKKKIKKILLGIIKHSRTKILKKINADESETEESGYRNQMKSNSKYYMCINMIAA